MRRALHTKIICVALCSFNLGAMAQQLKIESRGQAEEYAQKESVVAASIGKSVGLPAAGMAQVVFFRSSKSPGAAIDIAKDGAFAGEVPAGMYLALPASPGTHAYGPGALSLDLSAGETEYVQVIRNRAGQAQAIRSSASKFQNVARQAK